MANNKILTVTFTGQVPDFTFLDFEISQYTANSLPIVFNNYDFEYVTGAGGSNVDPWEVETPTTDPGVSGTTSAQALITKLDSLLLDNTFSYTRTDNVIVFRINHFRKFFSGVTFYGGPVTAVISDDLEPNGDIATITFTSEGIDTTELTMDIDQPDINNVESLVFDWTATPTNPYDVNVVPTVGIVGSQTAINFANVFIANNNQTNDYIVTVTDNVVTIQAIHPAWSFYWEITNTAGTADVTIAPTSLTVLSEILGQELTNVTTYCYLYEPLNAVIEESNLNAKKIYIDVEIIDTSDSTVVVETLSKYGEFDINPGNPISIGLMEMASQYHNANLYKISNTSDLITDLGKNSVVSKYRYNFLIYSDVTTLPILVSKLPIIGVREFEDFTPIVDENSPVTEAVQDSVNLENKWINYPYIETTLKDATLQDATPTITVTNQASGKVPCGGFIIWKSTLGGWMSWGMDLQNKNYNGEYTGSLQVNNFESNNIVNGSPYIPVNYTGRETSYNIGMKALALSKDELKVVSNIAYAPVTYFVRSDGKMQLMKMSSVTVPFDSQANGGDFSISLSGIERANQNVM